jgi:hypothetical protein
MPVSMAMPGMWVGNPITWQGWRARRGEAAKRGGASEASSVMTGAKLRAHTSVGKGRGMHASVHVYV